MSPISLWLAAAVAVLLPVVALALGLLDLRRDLVLLLMYGQVVTYMHLGPSAAAVGLESEVLARYVSVSWWTVLAFDIPFVALSVYLRRRWQHHGPAPALTVSRGRALLFLAGSVALGVGYVVAAVRNGLLYRRIGHLGLADRQLQMSLLDFAFYRTFIEFGLFLVLFCVVMVRRATGVSAATRRLLNAALVVVVGLYLSYALINSRLGVLLLVASTFVVYQATARKPVVFTP
ncbi:MAG TPA: hypothetical protein VFS20_16880, partial [Longimicrobium sp.]|nr:hypothetical protein [Longimicrobium sp.]